METQRARAASARRANAGPADTATAVYRELLDEIGPTEFTGRVEYETAAQVRGLVVEGARVDAVSDGPVAVVLDRTPFYAEAGGQVGDTGWLRTEGGTVSVVDTTYGLPGLVVHHGEVTDGALHVGDPVLAQIDGDRRDRIRRNHTATHILHWALRQVLGSHVQQKGSLVAPDRLRFDFSHYEAVTPEELEQVEDLTNREIITDAPVRHYETTKDHADALGAIAFFGDKYGDLVRVLEAGEHSLELCGGTHVHALGFIGPVKIVSESSIGANLRRIEAVTGDAALEHIRTEEHTLQATADALKVKPEELPSRVERLRDELRAVQAELAARRDREITGEAAALAARSVNGVVVETRDGHTNDELRRLAVAARDVVGHGVVGLVGASPDGSSATVAVAVSRDLVDQGITAAAIALPAATALGGGTGKKPADVAVGGGRNAAAVQKAQALLDREAHAAVDGKPKTPVGTAGDR